MFRASRPPGVSRKFPVFQQALQLATIAFSPDVRHPPLPAPPARPCQGSTLQHRVYELRRLKCPRTTTVTPHGRQSPSPATGRAYTSCTRGQRYPPRRPGREKGRSCFGITPPRPQLFGDFTFAPRGGGDGEEEAPCVTPPAPLTMTTGVDGAITMAPASMLAALEPSRLFDSGDMIMAAGLLDHPESSLKVCAMTSCVPLVFTSIPPAFASMRYADLASTSARPIPKAAK